jgi:hypothetical protein
MWIGSADRLRPRVSAQAAICAAVRAEAEPGVVNEVTPTAIMARS